MGAVPFNLTAALQSRRSDQDAMTAFSEVSQIAALFAAWGDEAWRSRAYLSHARLDFVPEQLMLILKAKLAYAMDRCDDQA